MWQFKYATTTIIYATQFIRKMFNLFEGIYAFCISNLLSRFSAKLIYFYMVTYVVDEWETFAQNFEDFDSGVRNSTVRRWPIYICL